MTTVTEALEVAFIPPIVALSFPDSSWDDVVNVCRESQKTFLAKWVGS